MPAPCHVCGEEEYECENGLYFCTTCSTQSQQVVEEELDYDGRMNTNFHGLIVKKAKPVKEAVKESKECGRPWIPIEGLTILLREQVKALISMGASPDLQDVVLKFWMYYLKITGQGFGAETISQENKRSEYLPTFARPEPLNLQMTKHMYRKRKGASKETVEQRQALRTAFGLEDFYEEDNPLAAGPEETTEIDMDVEEEVARRKDIKPEGQSMGFYNQTLKTAGQDVSLIHSLAFCYIGLQYTKNLVSISDLTRCARLGYLPYNQGPVLFPPDMMFTGRNWIMFSRLPPTDKHLFSITANLIKLLELKPFPIPDIDIFALRYIYDLNLPAGLHCLVRAMTSIHQPTHGVKDIIHDYSLLAMAYVIIATKMVFGLNDEKEKETSWFSSCVQKALGPELDKICLFDWDDWLKDQAVRRTKALCISDDWSDVRTATDIKPFCRAFDSYVGIRSAFESVTEVTTREKVTKILQQMCGKCGVDIGALPERSNELPAQDPEQSAYCGDNVQGWKPLIPPNCMEDTDLKDYTRHSIPHLLDWTSFVKTISEHLESQQEQCSQDESTTQEKTNSIVHQLEEMSDCVPKPWENYSCYKCSNNMKNCHKSYLHFVETAASCVGDEVALHHLVQGLEMVYFAYTPGLEKTTKQMAYLRRCMRRDYFIHKITDEDS